MKKLLLLTAFIGFCSKAFPQVYGNEWINYSQQYYRLQVIQDGWYRIPTSSLTAIGIPVNSINGSGYELFRNGAEIPIYVSTNNTFGSGDYIEFYGLRNDGILDSALYQNHEWQGNERLSFYNDTSSYFLTWISGASSNHFSTVPNNIAGHPPKEPYCWYTSENFYGKTNSFGLRLSSLYYLSGQSAITGYPFYESDFQPTECYTGNLWGLNTSYSFSIPTPHVHAGVQSQLSMKIIGYKAYDHDLSVSINSNPLFHEVFSLYKVLRKDTTLPVSWIGPSTTTLSFTKIGTLDRFMIPWVDVKYARDFDFDNAASFKFNIDGSAGNKYIEVGNFDEQGTTPVLYDFTNKLRMQAVVQNDTEKFLLPASNNERVLRLVADGGAVEQTIDTLFTVHFIDFSQPTNQGDFIIITHPFFFDDGAGNNRVEEYRQLKQNSEGYNAKIVNILDLYDEFAYGVRRSPLSIRNFSNYVLDNWNVQDPYFFLVGKGTDMLDQWNDSTHRDRNFIPTWGIPGSDVMLTSTNASPVPRIPIGRFSCIDADQIKNYTDKMSQFIDAQQDTLVQTIANDLWTKHIIHLLGGSTEAEQNLFGGYLTQFEQIIEDTFYGGHVFPFVKKSSDPVELATSEYIHSLLKDGVSMITFFGHSAANTFDFNLDHPDAWDNIGKYPLILTNGCLTGNLFNYYPGLPDSFVSAQQRGAIAFLSPAGYTTDGTSFNYSFPFYKNLGVNRYNQTLGKVIQGAIADDAVNFGDMASLITAEQFLLNGDPSIRINTHSRPDYDIENDHIFFTPASVSAGQDSFTLNVVIANLGKAINDSIYVNVERKFPDGHAEYLYHRKIHATYYLDTVRFRIETKGIGAFGLNSFCVKVDADVPTDFAVGPGAVDEISETNNGQCNIYLFISAHDIVPVFPYEYSIVGEQGVTLKASTVDPFDAPRAYRIQIDTTTLFNSSQFHETTVTQSGGVVSWTPAFNMLDSMVYYWRTCVDTVAASRVWHTTSFIYLHTSSPGWNQSHFYQFLNDSVFVGNIELPTFHKWKFVDDVKSISVYDGKVAGYGGQLTIDQPTYYINGVMVGKFCCGLQGAFFAVIDSTTGLQWHNYPPNSSIVNVGRFNSELCSASQQQDHFDYTTNQLSYNQNVVNFLDSVPDNDYVLMMTMNNAYMDIWSPLFRSAFTNLGASAILSIDSSTGDVPYVCFFKKNNNSYPFHEVVGDSLKAIIDTSFTIVGQWNQGFVQSPVIGPASSWTALHWKAHEIEPGFDQYHLELIGIDNNGTETVLYDNIPIGDLQLSSVSALQYPYLRLRLNTIDTFYRTPLQLDFWRINYQPIPEAALNPAAFFQQSADSVAQFIPLTISVAVENLTPWGMDSMLMHYLVTDAQSGQHQYFKRYSPLAGDSTIHVTYDIPTDCDCYGGVDYVMIEANPNADQPEQFHWNNVGIIDFKVSTDNVNPLLDVTFDGVHIMNNDIVSAKPVIAINLKDESKYLGLDNDSLFKIYYLFPDGSHHDVVFDNATNFFYPADPQHLSKDNTAKAELKPIFSVDGKYTLVVQGFDRSANASGDNSYSITFEVINKPMISNVLPYPNPFSTSTRFVFTMTGSEIPQFMKIEILTITGKVVKEIMVNDLGFLHIGTNISDYTWDGTDQYGGRLANGLYFYRVVTNLNGKELEHYDNGTDGYFKHGIGKIYLMR